MVSDHRRLRNHHSVNRVLAVVILLVMVGASVLGVVNAHQMRAQAECQSQANRQFLAALSTNTETNTANREALDEAIASMAEATTEAEEQQALTDYLDERERIEAMREDYPPLPEEVCE